MMSNSAPTARPTAGAPLSSRLLALVFAATSLAGCGQRVPGTPPAAATAGAPAAAAANTARTPLPLIPAAVEVKRGSGSFVVGTGTVISIVPGDADARRSAEHLADLLLRTRGLRLEVRAETSASPGSIRLERSAQAPVAHKEGYSLEVDAKGVRIAARDGAGLLYGAVSAWQLMTPDTHKGEVQLPSVAIRDWPRFSWRGQHLDVARHFHDVDTVKHVLDTMALHKLNVLHWHLTDDQGWRIEIKRYPKLTEVGAWRTPPGAGMDGIPQRYGGFYTQEQISEIVAYAARLHITVLPEIDMPGHAQAAVAAYPEEVGVPGVRTQVGVDWGVNPYLFNTSERSLTFITNVLDEVLTLFPSTYIHIGGDEAVKDQWEASPAVRAQMRKLGVKDAHAMQGWFNEQLAAYLTQHGRRMIGWDEILEGGVPASASVMSWRGVEGAVTAAKQGHDVVLAPGDWLYLDNLQTTRNDEPNGRLTVLPLSKVYAFDPVPAGLSAEQARHVLGAQGALWSEYISSRWHVDHALFPRLSAVAEVTWSPKAARNWNSFLARMPAQLQRYKALSIDYSDGAFAADIALENGPNPVLTGGPAKVALSTQTGAGTLHYTIDGSHPTPASPRYNAPFTIQLPTTVKATAFDANGTPLAATRSRTFDRAGLLRVDTQGLQHCVETGALGLRLPLLPEMTAADTPVYNVDLFHACRMYPQARLDGIGAIRIDAARLPNNFGLAHEQSKVVQYPANTRGGELEVRQGCDGELIASVQLPRSDTLGEQFTLETALPARTGIHDLCLRFTAPIRGPLYAIGAVQLIETTAQAPPAATR
ncbi:family 20 glycosylhydrolase [Xanthomonas oryzae pv. oryzicola]|uniref:family 20 glycosylhydrolase n=1 Tax=Xanthomonas oryzae TaxID=347 RepID=UPI000949EE09|nr:family 20 glycosylhydrolase [Xanthomonas oryzae]OLI10367.1 beta-hexosaminidase [Xanthomonas oryzae pv. oryzae]OWB17144.1 beta-hexosaminidase [Xanthomonas oryzae pv. oryzicola]